MDQILAVYLGLMTWKSKTKSSFLSDLDCLMITCSLSTVPKGNPESTGSSEELKLKINPREQSLSSVCQKGCETKSVKCVNFIVKSVDNCSSRTIYMCGLVLYGILIYKGYGSHVRARNSF